MVVLSDSESTLTCGCRSRSIIELNLTVALQSKTNQKYWKIPRSERDLQSSHPPLKKKNFDFKFEKIITFIKTLLFESIIYPAYL